MADRYARRAPEQWANEPSWGIFGVPETQLRLFPDDLAGLDVVELGCGTGYVSAWAARRGARPVGLDNSPRQLATARRMQEQFGLRFPLLHADAERLPLPDAAFDFAISEYGASIWCDPRRWLPEAARVLRPGGRLVFLRNSTVLMLCVPDVGVAGDRLLRPLRGMYRMTWESEPGVEFQPGHGELLRLLRGAGFEVEDLVEVYAPDDGAADYDFVTADWARRWPAEEVWYCRRH
jgi:SAM-dependent methyltransferase